MDDGQLSSWCRRSPQLVCWSTQWPRVWLPGGGASAPDSIQPECIHRQAVIAVLALEATKQF